MALIWSLMKATIRSVSLELSSLRTSLENVMGFLLPGPSGKTISQR